MSRSGKNKSDNPDIQVGKVIPLLDLLKICHTDGLRLWVQTSCPPAYLPVDMDFMLDREKEMYKSRKYHAIWVEVTTNHSLNNGIIHAKYTEYRHSEKPPYAPGWASDERQRQKNIRILKLLKTIKHKKDAKDQNLHNQSLSSIRRKRSIH